VSITLRKILKESINFNKRNYIFLESNFFFLKKPYNRKLHVPFFYVYIPNHQQNGKVITTTIDGKQKQMNVKKKNGLL
jgi:hypothetical protein